MLAGLLFAIHVADDRPDRLAATLPFSGVTLIEYQARLLIAAGVRQVIVVVARLTPELLGAINRINRRGVAVDTVRTAAEAMVKLALEQPGCLGAESARGADGFGITNAYFTDEAAILAWKNHARHLAAQKLGQERWYEHYELRVAKVERAYSSPEKK